MTAVLPSRYKLASQQVQHWTKRCREQARDRRIKLAADPTTSQDMPFESAFSNLAHATLKDRAPNLLEFELGFQLLKKTEDNQQAVGIFGFQVGQQLLYAPVFWLRRELKGQELLYLKDSDTFVPLQEDWINYILNRKPDVLGRGVPRAMPYTMGRKPDLTVFRNSPSKYASEMPPWLQEGLPGLLHAANHVEPLEPVMPQLVKASASIATWVLRLVDMQPLLARAMTHCYGPEFLKTALATAKTANSIMPARLKAPPKSAAFTGSIFVEKKASAPDPNNKLQIYTYAGSRPAGLSDEEFTQLKIAGMLVKDAREETSHVYRTRTPMSLSNPNETGIYDVLVSPGDSERCLFVQSPFAARGRNTVNLLVRLDESARAWKAVSPDDVFAFSAEHRSEYTKWFEGLKEADSLSKYGVYMLVGPTTATMPFEVGPTMPGSGSKPCYKIYWRDGYARRSPYLPAVATESNSGRIPEYIEYIVLDSFDGTVPHIRGDSLYIPRNWKILKLKSPPEHDDEGAGCGCGGESEPPPLRPGNLLDLEMEVSTKTAELKITADAVEATINGRTLPTTAALVSLMRQHGLSHEKAAMVLKVVQRSGGERFRIKYADGYQDQYYDLQNQGPTAPPVYDPQYASDNFMGSGLPTQEAVIEQQPVQGMERGDSSSYDLLRDPNPQVLQQITEAAQTGQREVLDTSMLSSLLNHSREDTIIDAHLGPMAKGLDHNGRTLFNLYWHHDVFEERFGSQELPELEDELRNAFEATGKVVLKLRKKSIDTGFDHGMASSLDTTSK